MRQSNEQQIKSPEISYLLSKHPGLAEIPTPIGFQIHRSTNSHCLLVNICLGAGRVPLDRCYPPGIFHSVVIQWLSYQSEKVCADRNDHGTTTE